MNNVSEFVLNNCTINLLMPYDSWRTRALAELAAKMAFFNFEWRFITIVLFIESTTTGVSDFIRAYQNTVVVKKEPLIKTGKAHSRQFVLYGKSLLEINLILDFIVEETFDNTGRYLIVCSDPLCDEESVMKTCSNMKIVNVLFVKMLNEFGDSAVFTYYPFSPNKCEGWKPVELKILQTCEHDICFKNLYEEKFGNLYKCPIIASTFHQPPFMFVDENSNISGGDGDLLLLLVDLVNATLAIVTPSHGEGTGHFENNEWTGSLGDIYQNRANFSMTSGAISYKRYRNFHVSFPYNSIDIIWVTSPSPLKPSWEKIVYPYKIKIRLLLVFIFGSVTILNSLLKTQCWNKIRKYLNIKAQRNSLLFRSWMIFMGLPVGSLPTKAALSTIFLMWVWFSFIIRTGYQAMLISSLKLNVYEPEYENFKAAAFDKRIPFGGLASVKDYYIEDSWIQLGWVEIPSSETFTTMSKLSLGELNFLLAINRETALHFFKFNSGKHKLQIIPEKIVNSPAAIFFKQFSPLADPMSRLLTVVLEAGLSQRLFNIYSPGMRALKDAWARGQNYPQPLQLDHFTGCWVLIIAGWILAFVFFLVELFCGRDNL